ncbi:hypothetical protein EDB80DRAFT_727716 [Ilyonectria destructans]|nr:hypothetical protein EDB80DRAFT_727716 [Ilyonectria destructans]
MGGLGLRACHQTLIIAPPLLVSTSHFPAGAGLCDVGQQLSWLQQSGTVGAGGMAFDLRGKLANCKTGGWISSMDPIDSGPGFHAVQFHFSHFYSLSSDADVVH